MEKRTFIRLSLAGAAGSLILPRMALSKAMESALASKYAGGLYQTDHAWGRWNAKVAGLHLAHTEKQLTGGKVQLHVESRHPMLAYEHYIVKHEILDADFKFLAEHRYDPRKDKKPASVIDLGSYRGIVYAVTYCNIHDLWVDVSEV